MTKYSPGDYLRIGIGIFGHPKLDELVDDHGRDAWLVWLYTLVQAKRAERLGRVALRPNSVARALTMQVQETTRIIDDMVRVKLLCTTTEPGVYQVRKWSQWQPMTAAERQRVYRRRKQKGKKRNAKPSRPDTTASPGDNTRHDTTRHNNPPSPKGDSPPHGGGSEPKGRRTTKGKSDKEVDQLIADARKALGTNCSAMVDDLVTLMAAENKTGKVAVSRTQRELWTPLAEAMPEVGEAAMLSGLRAAIGASAPNRRYVLKAARGYLRRSRQRRGEQEAPAGRSSVVTTDDFVVPNE